MRHRSLRQSVEAQICCGIEQFAHARPPTASLTPRPTTAKPIAAALPFAYQRLQLDVLVQALRPELAADAGLLEAAERAPMSSVYMLMP